MSDDIRTVRTFEDALLRGRDVETGYGDLQVLFGVDVDVRDDEIVLVFGPNGAGKSTLLRALCKLLSLWEGRVTVDDRDVSDREPEEMIDQGVCYVPQAANVFPNLTVDETLEFLELDHLADEYARGLSGGQRKLLELGRVLMLDPELIMLDEPVAGVNPALTDDLLDRLHALNDEGRTLLLIEHDMDVVMTHCDHVVVVADGRELAAGPPEAVRTDERVVEAYLGGER